MVELFYSLYGYSLCMNWCVLGYMVLSGGFKIIVIDYYEI